MLTLNEEKQAKNKALKIVHSRSFIATRQYLTPSSKKLYLDMRYSFNRAVFAEVRKLCKNVNFDALKAKQMSRARYQDKKPENWINSPLVIDYRKNKSDIMLITDQRLYFFNGRNHWAKTPTDLKMLSILRKHFNTLKS